jgi:hypothetical protein
MKTENIEDPSRPPLKGRRKKQESREFRIGIWTDEKLG